MSKKQNTVDQDNSSNSSNEQILEREPIEGTPFTITGNKEQGYAITFGNYRLGDLRETKQIAYLDLEEHHWTITARLAGIIAEKAIEQNQDDLH